jgi:adenylosuccinate lyase
MNSLQNISPIDGRYKAEIEVMRQYFSESALMRYRLKIEVEYLIALSHEDLISELLVLSETEQQNLRNLYQNFNLKDAERIKTIENTTRHDVKAVEYYLQEKLKNLNLDHLLPWTHFALTSEDINNLAYTLMWQESVREQYLPLLCQLVKSMTCLAKENRSVAILALTHGQPATPTTLGKEIAVFVQRLKTQGQSLQKQIYDGKLGGATGTWSAHQVAYPKVDWIAFTEEFIQNMGLAPNCLTTQILPGDQLAAAYHNLIRINNILTDLCRDIWLYISRGIFCQQKVSGEVGSSTMPHKINPIQFENAEGNLGLSTAVLSQLANYLTISRLQRDLSGSTLIRNQGVALGHAYLALQNIVKGFRRLRVDLQQTEAELKQHWEVLAEAIQTILRKHNQADAYERLKELTQGMKIDAQVLQELIMALPIPKSDKKRLMELSPSKYIGIAEKLVDRILDS